MTRNRTYLPQCATVRANLTTVFVRTQPGAWSGEDHNHYSHDSQWGGVGQIALCTAAEEHVAGSLSNLPGHDGVSESRFYHISSGISSPNQ